MNTAANKAGVGSRVSAPGYSWLLFDADGTLFDCERAERAALEQALTQTGVPLAPGYLATYQRINKALWQGVERGEITPGVVKVRRFERLLEAIQVTHACWYNPGRKPRPDSLEITREIACLRELSDWLA